MEPLLSINGVITLINGLFVCIHMDVSKNRGIPKWMVKIMENPIKMDDLGVPLFLETPICIQKCFSQGFAKI